MRFDFNLPYDKKYLIRCLLGFAVAALLMKVTGGAGFVAVFLLLFTCFSRNNMELLFYTLVLTICLTLSNSTIIPKGGIFGFAQRIMMLTLSGIMFVRLPGMKKSPILKCYPFLVLYLAFMILSSTYGWCPIISYLKIFLFFMVYMAYFSVSNAILVSTHVNTKKIRSVFLAMCVFFLFGSIALIPFPGYGQMSWEEVQQSLQSGGTLLSLFRGMTQHSQMMGPIASMLGVMLFADLAFSIRKPNKLYLALLACVPILLWKTSSRTAMGSFVAGIGFTMFFFMQARGVKSTWKSKVTSTIMMLVAVLGIAILIVPAAREKAIGFALKFNKEDNREVTFDEFFATRRGKWDTGLENFKKSPLLGNGFQVSEGMVDMKPSLTTLSAPVEKGVWITAILEEGGAVGMLIFLSFAFLVSSSLLRNKCYQGLVGFFMLLLINMGEFVVFSMTATGGILWACAFIGVVLDGRHRSDERKLSMSQLGMPPPLFWTV